MSDPIVIDAAVAERDGLDVSAMIAWYKAARGIVVVAGDVKLVPSNSYRVCRSCGERKVSTEFARYASRKNATGKIHDSCVTCVERKRAEHARLTCATCGVEKAGAEFRDRLGYLRSSCDPCRGRCFKPPYGWTTCPGCSERRHRDEFRVTPSGKPKPGRPYETCESCRKSR